MKSIVRAASTYRVMKLLYLVITSVRGLLIFPLQYHEKCCGHTDFTKVVLQIYIISYVKLNRVNLYITIYG